MSDTIIMYENGKAVGGEGHPTNADEITFNNEDTDLVSNKVGSAIKEVNAKLVVKADKTDIAPVESSSTASASHATGSQFYFNGQLVTATVNISIGGTIVLNGNCTLADSVTKQINDVISDVSRLKGDIQVPATITTENAFCREIGRAVATILDNSSVAKSVLWADHNIYSLIATRRSVYITGLLSCQSSVLSFSYTITSDTVSGIKITGTAI